jgi:hypothetical protein
MNKICVSNTSYTCMGCGASKCRLWREYQTFSDRTQLLCATCAEKDQGRKLEPKCDQIGWLVPAIPVDGEDARSFWGYSSVPAPRLEWWYSLPERPGVEQ